MTATQRRVFIGGAWPYANGSLHLGHVAALLGGDVLARYHRLRGDRVLYVSGSDCHGTPIALEAERRGVSPGEVADAYHAEFRATFEALRFSYDAYTRTTTDNHRAVVQEAFTRLLEAGLIGRRTQRLAYCERDRRFLPDRYVEGTCPHCGTAGARGDQCDACGRVLDPPDLREPRCKFCGETPVWRDSEHFFLLLPRLQERLFAWLEGAQGWRRNATTYVRNIVSEGLRERAITRDTSWGVPLPLEGYGDKRIYVWFEAVCGYLSASVEWAGLRGEPEAWRDFWEAPGDAALHYYIHGKDNIPFHAIIWPAILMGLGGGAAGGTGTFRGAGLRLPDRLYSSEYLTFGQRQFSKSRGLVIRAADAAADHGSDAVRYTLLSNGPENADSDFTWEDFQARVNGELIAKLGNFVNRSLSFAAKHWPDGLKAPAAPEPGLEAEAAEAFAAVGRFIEAGEFREGLRAVLRLAESGNRYIDAQAPWKAVKEDRAKAEAILVRALWLSLALAKLVRPFLPEFAGKVVAQLGLTGQEDWSVPVPGPAAPRDVAPLVRKVEIPAPTEPAAGA